MALKACRGLPRSRLLLIAVASALMSVGWLLRAAAAQPSFEEIVAHLNQVNASLHTLVAEQAAEIRVLGVFRWRLHATVYAARPASYKVVLHDPPWLLRSLGGVFSDISSPEKVLMDYRATAVRRVGEARLAVEIEGRTPRVNPPAGSIVINAERWLVEGTVLQYEWGDVRAIYVYDQIEGYLLPVLIRAAVSRFALEAVVTYSGYRLNVPIPPGVFEAAAGR